MILKIFFVFLLIWPGVSTANMDGGIPPEICGTADMVFKKVFLDSNYTVVTPLTNKSNRTFYPVSYTNFTEVIHIKTCTLDQDMFSYNKPFVKFTVGLGCDKTTIKLSSDIEFNTNNSNMSMIYIQSNDPSNPQTIDLNGYSFRIRRSTRIVFANLNFINGHPAISLAEVVGTTHVCNVTFDGEFRVTNASGIHLICSSLYLYSCNFTRYNTTFQTNHIYEESTYRTPPFMDYNDSISGGALTGIFWHSDYVGEIAIRDTMFYMNEVHNRTEMRNNSKFVSWASGGGVFLIFKDKTMGNKVEIFNSHFVKNVAGAFGGGLFATFHDNSSNNTICIEDSVFDKNHAYVSSGGVGIFHDGFSINNGIYLTRVNFTRNFGFRAGGGFNILYNFQYPQEIHNFRTFYLNYPSFIHLPTPAFFTDCLFDQNSATLDAAALQAWSFISYLIHPSPIVFDNCTFSNNHAKGYAAILASGITIIFRGTTRIVNNSNSGLYLSYASTQFIGKIHFEGNTNRNVRSGGGGLRLYDGSYLYVNLYTELHFHNNTAYKGPAIYIDTDVLHTVDYNVYFSTDCSIQIVNYDENNLPVVDKNIFFFVEYNYEIYQNGTVNTDSYPLFMTNLDDCISGEIESLKVDNRENALKDNNHTILFGNLNITRDILYRYVETDPSKVTTLNRSLSSFNLSGYPGEVINLPFLKVLDQLGARTKATLFLQPNDKHKLVVYPGVVVIEKTNSTTHIEMQYYILDKSCINTTINLTLTAITAAYQLEHVIPLHIAKCPEYLVLKSNAYDNNSYYCGLSSSPRENPLFLNYDEKNAIAYIKEGTWLGFSRGKVPCNDTCQWEVFIQNCPTGFCHCTRDPNHVYPGCQVPVLKETIDEQCVSNRTSLFCGICSEGYSVGLKSFECRKCDVPKKVVGTLVAILDLVILVSFCIGVLWWNISYPPELAGVLFYVQIVSIVYNASTNGWVIFQFFWLPLKFYIDNNVMKTILDPCTPFDNFKVIYSIIYQLNDFVTVIVILVIFYFLTRYVKTFYNHNFINGFVFLAIFTYVTFAQVSFYFLNFEIAPDKIIFGLQTDIPYKNVAPFAALFLLFALLVPFLFIISAFGCISRAQILKDVLREPYKPHLWYWTGIDLLRRLLIVIVIVSTTYPSVRKFRDIAICFAVLVILLAHVFAQPYKKRWCNFIEGLVLFDLFMLAAFNVDVNLSVDNVFYVDLILVLLPLIYALCYIGYQVFIKIKPKAKGTKFIENVKTSLQKKVGKKATLAEPLLINEQFEDSMNIEMKNSGVGLDKKD